MAGHCSQCGSSAKEGDEFCGKCGAPIASAPTEPVQPGAPDHARRRRWAVAAVGALLLLLAALLAWWLLSRDDPYACDEPQMEAVAAAAVARPGAGDGSAGDGGAGPDADPALPPPSPGQPAGHIALLDLPFPYDGGNTSFGGTSEQFRQAIRRAAYGGRLTGFFDHQFPMYPAQQLGLVTSSIGREPTDFGGTVLTFQGAVSTEDAYTGHPGYDFSPYERGRSTTPLFAAADGIVESAREDMGSGGLFVHLVHDVPGLGQLQTRYWHLEPDQHFSAMRGMVGRVVRQGERIGTIGNTGFSLGHHLHFEVRLDKNNDGRFSHDEKIDPFGFTPSAGYPTDPWAQPLPFGVDAKSSPVSHVPMASQYLWVHSLGGVAVVSDSGGGSVSQQGTATGGGGDANGHEPPAVDDEASGVDGVASGDDGVASGDDALPDDDTLCAKSDTLPPDSIVHWHWGPDPAPTDKLAGAGEGCSVSAFAPDGTPITSFDKPLVARIAYDNDNLDGIRPETLAVYTRAFGEDEWRKTDTRLDEEAGVATALIHEPGLCALMGEPSRDMVMPRTRFVVDGPQDADGHFYDSVTVTLEDDGPDKSGVVSREYSLDAGSTWRRYDRPIRLEAEEIPDVWSSVAGGPKPELPASDASGAADEEPLSLAPVAEDLAELIPEEAGEGFGTGPGRHLVLARSIDGAGNQEYPPAARLIIIDSRKDPDRAAEEPSADVPVAPSTATATAIVTVTPTPVPTVSPTPAIGCPPEVLEPPPGESCVTLSWHFENITAVYLDGEGVAGYGERDVCPLETTTYALEVVLPDGAVSECATTVIVETTPTPTDITPPTAPRLLKPRDGSVVAPGDVALGWDHSQDDLSGVASYDYELRAGKRGCSASGGNTFGTLVIVTASADESCLWRVRARDNAGNLGAWSAAWEFSTRSAGSKGPSAPKLQSPANSSAVGNSATLEWSPSKEDGSGISRYEFEVSGCAARPSSGSCDCLSAEVMLPENVQCSWRVRAVDNSGIAGPWSTTWWFYNGIH